MPAYTVTRPIRPYGVIVAKVRAASPDDAVREADAGGWGLNREFAAEGYRIDRTAVPEVWELHGWRGRTSRHVQGPTYSDGPTHSDAETSIVPPGPGHISRTTKNGAIVDVAAVITIRCRTCPSVQALGLPQAEGPDPAVWTARLEREVLQAIEEAALHADDCPGSAVSL